MRRAPSATSSSAAPRSRRRQHVLSTSAFLPASVSPPANLFWSNRKVRRVSAQMVHPQVSVIALNRDGTVRLENLTTVELEDRGVATEVTVRVQVLRATPDARENLAGMREGWSESLDRLGGLKTMAAARPG